MSKCGLVRGAVFLAALLCVSILPVCRGAACCAPSAQVARVFQLVAAPILLAAQEQASPNSSSSASAPAAHKVKVWTNEDLIATRTPADLYIFQKEADASALEMEGFNNLASCFAFGQPEGNAEETQKEIDATLQSIRGSEEAVAQSRKALRTAPENLKLRNEMELAQRMSELNHAREHLWTLQEHLQEIEKSPTQQSVPTPNPQPQN
jgi:small-conductance mechanosensitive channel